MRRLRMLAVAAVLASLAAFVPVAAARVLDASSILPPGESGFVSIAGLLKGTGSPHLYDQQRPFTAFARKSAMLGQRGTAELPRPGVRIVRDAYGVPSVSGRTASGLWWGAGWVTAQDRLFELDLFRRTATGQLAQLLGARYLPADIGVRRDFYTPRELSAMLASLPASMRARYVAYAAGINAWIDHVDGDLFDMPAEFLALGVRPAHFSVTQLVAIGVYFARTTPNTDGTDLTNMKAIQRSGPARFDRILPLRIAGQVATVPSADGLFPSDPGRTAEQERAALARSYAYVRSLPLPGSGNLGDEYLAGSPPPASAAGMARADGDGASPANPLAAIRRGGSYMVAVSDPRRRRAYLFNGPELGFSAPEELYEIELHGPGVAVRGVTAPGAPVVAIGHNAHIAFGLTSGLSATNALYVERLVPGHPDEYYYRGAVRRMDCRPETFSYKASPAPKSVTLRLCRTVHGPVQERVGNVAYARRYATWMREIGTFAGLAELDGARNIPEVDRAARTLTWNENLMAADDHGGIGYWHPGLLPVRPTGWDERLPYPGSGTAEWRGFLAPEQRPHVLNPRRRWLANWNTLPSQGWTTGNAPAAERVAGPWFRGAYLDALAAAAARRPSFAAMNQLVRAAGTVAQQRPLAGPALRRALRGARGRAARLLRTILHWNGSYTAVDARGTVDPGVAAWQAFKDELRALAVAPLGAAGRLIGASEPNSEHVFDVSLGQAYALRTLGPAGWRRAAAATFADLARRFRTTDPAHWRVPRAMFKQSVQGAEQPPPMPFFDRGTFEQVVALGS